VSIAPGERIPSVSIKQATPEGGKEVDPTELFAGKNVVMFSLPGAFTPTCSKKHLPGFLARYDEFRAQGIDLVACLSVNDAWVMQAWADAHSVDGRIVMLADGSALFTRALGIESDKTKDQMGIRSRRGAFVIRDNVVETVELEEPGQFGVSSADACMTRVKRAG
jgi:peroxiredoxin (alkyl hydroperoxide reductase subunit C)